MGAFEVTECCKGHIVAMNVCGCYGEHILP